MYSVHAKRTRPFDIVCEGITDHQDQMRLKLQRCANCCIHPAIWLHRTDLEAEQRRIPSLIHNTYPDVAEEIRARLGRNTRQQRDAKAVELTDAKALHRILRAERDAALADLAKAVSINETLRRELDTLRGIALGKVTALRPSSAS